MKTIPRLLSLRFSLAALAAALFVWGTSGTAFAGYDIVFDQVLDQSQLDRLTRELGAALVPISMAPAEGLGTAHIDLFASATAARINEDETYWQQSVEGSPPSHFVTARATARVGLPKGIDIGAHYETAPSSNVRLVGGDVKWAFVKGSTFVPAVAARLGHSRMSGVDQLDLDITSLDLLVSKGLAIVTPYGGVGGLWVSSEVRDIPGARGFRLDSSEFVSRVFLGARVTVGFFNTTVEAQRAASVSSYSLKVGFIFP